jgi:hypothetical protein
MTTAKPSAEPAARGTPAGASPDPRSRWRRRFTVGQPVRRNAQFRPLSRIKDPSRPSIRGKYRTGGERPPTPLRSIRRQRLTRPPCFRPSKRDPAPRSKHSRIHVADRSHGCTRTASWRQFATGRPANGLPVDHASPAHGLLKGSSPSVEQLAQPLENEDCDAYPRRRRGSIIPGKFKDGQALRHEVLAAPNVSFALPFCRMHGTFLPALQSDRSIADALACRSQWPAGAMLTEPNLSLAESARSMHVTHRPSLARAPKPARSPESRWPQGLEVAVSGSSCLDPLHAIQRSSEQAAPSVVSRCRQTSCAAGSATG